MARYKFWNHVDDVYTPSGHVFSANEWENKYPWSRIPGVKMVVSNGVINGSFCGEFSAMVDACKSRGFVVDESMTDEEILLAIENFEDNPPIVENDTPSVEERTAAALEAIAMASLPDVE